LDFPICCGLIHVLDFGFKITKISKV